MISAFFFNLCGEKLMEKVFTEATNSFYKKCVTYYPLVLCWFQITPLDFKIQQCHSIIIMLKKKCVSKMLYQILSMRVCMMINIKDFHCL